MCSKFAWLLPVPNCDKFNCQGLLLRIQHLAKVKNYFFIESSLRNMLADKGKQKYITHYAQILNDQLEDKLSKSEPVRRYLISVWVIEECLKCWKEAYHVKRIDLFGFCCVGQRMHKFFYIERFGYIGI